MKSLYREFGLSLDDAASLVEATLEEIAAALIQGDAVKLSSFGTFSVRQKRGRMGRNPKTGKVVDTILQYMTRPEQACPFRKNA